MLVYALKSRSWKKELTVRTDGHCEERSQSQQRRTVSFSSLFLPPRGSSIERKVVGVLTSSVVYTAELGSMMEGKGGRVGKERRSWVGAQKEES